MPFKGLLHTTQIRKEKKRKEKKRREEKRREEKRREEQLCCWAIINEYIDFDWSQSGY